MRSARMLRVVTTRMPIRGTLRLAYLVTKRHALQGPHGQQTVVHTGRYQAWIRFHNPPEVALYFHGIYEPDLTAVLDAFLRPGDVAVDVGCNCGVVTLEMAARVGPTGRVIAVDPSPLAADRTRQQAALNGFWFVDVHHAALEPEERGRITYYQSSVGIGALPETELRYTTGARVEVVGTTLDQLLSARGEVRADLIKVDTDGHELSVLSGGQRALTHRPLMLLEMTPQAMRRNGQEPGALLALLDRLGYRYLVPRRNRWFLYSRHDFLAGSALLKSGYTGNFIAYQPGDPRHAEVARHLSPGIP
jgi:FkbM family methyltransferase